MSSEQKSSAEDKLWEWANKQDDISVGTFATGLIGIGALFFAYHQVPFGHIGLLVALVGFGGSIILWLHLYAARREYYLTKEMLRKNKYPFIEKLDSVQSWRFTGRKNKILYHPIARLMTYFMGLVSWGWLTIVIRRLGWLSVEMLTYVSIGLLVFTLVLTAFRKSEDIRKKGK